MFMVLSSWQSHCDSSPGSFDECRTAPSGRRPKTKPDDLGCESACTGCQNLHPPSPFIIMTQPESWYSFYSPTEGRRLSRPSWLVTYRDGLPVHRQSPILVLTGSDVAQLRYQRVTTKPNCQPHIFVKNARTSTTYWWVITYVGKPSAVGQPTRPTQPFILSGSIDSSKLQLDGRYHKSVVAHEKM